MGERGRAQPAMRRGVLPALLGLSIAFVWAAVPSSEASADDLKLKLSDQIGPVDTRVETMPVGGSAGRPTSPGTTLKLSLDLEYRYNNNIFVTQTSRQSDFIRSAIPQVSWSTPWGKHRLGLDYGGIWTRHERFSTEDIPHHDFGANVELDLHRKFDVELDAGLELGADSRESLTARNTATGSPDRWRAHRIGASFRLGRRIAAAQLQLDLDHGGTRYLNNGQEARDIDVQSYSLEGLWNLRPRLSLVSTASVSFNDYQEPAVPLDSREFEVLFGASWEATAKTNGRILVGHLWKDFDDPSQGDFSGRSWRGEVEWSPRSFSRLKAYTSRDATESAFDGVGTSIVDSFGLAWRHGLTQRFIINAGVDYSTSDSGNGVQDNELTVGFGFDYVLTRRLGLSMGYSSIGHSSNAADTRFNTKELYILLSGSWDGPSSRTDR